MSDRTTSTAQPDHATTCLLKPCIIVPLAFGYFFVAEVNSCIVHDIQSNENLRNFPILYPVYDLNANQ